MIIKLLTTTLTIAFFSLSGIYQFNVPTIDGGNFSLSDCQGKKILIITLPVLQSAASDSLLSNLDSIASAHSNDLKIIAVPTYEDGFTPSIRSSLRQWLRSKLDTGIVIADGLYVQKSSSQQHPLFKWLTDVGQNEVFDMDVAGPGHKFFIKKTGELYGVLVPNTSVSGSTTNRVINMFE